MSPAKVLLLVLVVWLLIKAQQQAGGRVISGKATVSYPIQTAVPSEPIRIPAPGCRPDFPVTVSLAGTKPLPSAFFLIFPQTIALDDEIQIVIGDPSMLLPAGAVDVAWSYIEPQSMTGTASSMAALLV